MEKIASFKVDHLKLMPGLYVSRKDYVGSEVVTTFDMRVCKPNVDKVMDTGSIHTYEHLGATFLRNHKEYKEEIVYFGPMGCRTGFYVIFSKDYQPTDILELIYEMNEFVINYQGEIPGATSKDCGNYLDMNLSGAKEFALKYKKDFLSNPKPEQLVYEL